MNKLESLERHTNPCSNRSAIIKPVTAANTETSLALAPHRLQAEACTVEIVSATFSPWTPGSRLAEAAAVTPHICLGASMTAGASGGEQICASLLLDMGLKGHSYQLPGWRNHLPQQAQPTF